MAAQPSKPLLARRTPRASRRSWTSQTTSRSATPHPRRLPQSAIASPSLLVGAYSAWLNTSEPGEGWRSLRHGGERRGWVGGVYPSSAQPRSGGGVMGRKRRNLNPCTTSDRGWISRAQRWRLFGCSSRAQGGELDADATKLIALGADPGLTLDDLSERDEWCRMCGGDGGWNTPIGVDYNNGSCNRAPGIDASRLRWEGDTKVSCAPAEMEDRDGDSNAE